jgi:hypothetical protein
MTLSLVGGLSSTRRPSRYPANPVDAAALVDLATSKIPFLENRVPITVYVVVVTSF